MPTPLIVGLIIGIAIIVWASRCIFAAPRLHTATRVVAALTFVPVALFCLYGFAAAMEPGDYHIVWRVGYATVFLVSLFAAGWLVFAKQVTKSIEQQ